MFGDCFFLLFSVFKNNFLFFKLKNLFDKPKWTEKKIVLKTKGMFGNCFFPLFSVFKNKFLFLRLKNLFDKLK